MFCLRRCFRTRPRSVSSSTEASSYAAARFCEPEYPPKPTLRGEDAGVGGQNSGARGGRDGARGGGHPPTVERGVGDDAEVRSCGEGARTRRTRRRRRNRPRRRAPRTLPAARFALSFPMIAPSLRRARGRSDPEKRTRAAANVVAPVHRVREERRSASVSRLLKTRCALTAVTCTELVALTPRKVAPSAHSRRRPDAVRRNRRHVRRVRRLRAHSRFALRRPPPRDATPRARAPSARIARRHPRRRVATRPHASLRRVSVPVPLRATRARPAGAPVEEKFWEWEGHRIRYTCAGEEGPAMILSTASAGTPTTGARTPPRSVDEDASSPSTSQATGTAIAPTLCACTPRSRFELNTAPTSSSDVPSRPNPLPPQRARAKRHLQL